MFAVFDGGSRDLLLPTPDTPLLPGIPWGAFDEFLTPAYWKGQAWQHEHLGTYAHSRLGRSLAEELAACLLGGFGMAAELGLAAYQRILDRGLLLTVPTVEAVETALCEPFDTADGHQWHYRFPHQKARYLVECLAALEDLEPPTDDLALRSRLVTLPGIGPKTASWIVRNHRASDAVAIIDVHILRAGRHLRLFQKHWTPQRHYAQLEARFLQFAAALDVRPALLDALVWDYMRRLNSSNWLNTPGPKPYAIFEIPPSVQ